MFPYTGSTELVFNSSILLSFGEAWLAIIVFDPFVATDHKAGDAGYVDDALSCVCSSPAVLMDAATVTVITKVSFA